MPTRRFRPSRRPVPGWWPEGEPGPDDPTAVRPRFRRRFLVAAGLGLLAVIATGIGLGIVFGRSGGPPRGEWEGPRPFGLVFVLGGIALVASLATAVAYRRLAVPTGELLAAADRVGTGDYDVRVEPAGPAELRRLMATFNEMAGRLRATEASRRRFLADVTHELRTPLAVIQAGLEAQLDGIHPRDDRHLGSLHEETRMVARLIEDLHTLAVTEAGQLRLHREAVLPRVLVDDAVATVESPVAAKGVRIDILVAGDVGNMEVDPARIRQVLTNVLANAVRHTPPGGQVTVRVRRERSGWTDFIVSDTGPGFPADAGAVFERFVKAADSSGSGLGLAIARDLVVAHGGTISAANEPSGGGSVRIRLPDQAGESTITRTGAPRSG